MNDLELKIKTYLYFVCLAAIPLVKPLIAKGF